MSGEHRERDRLGLGLSLLVAILICCVLSGFWLLLGAIVGALQ